MGDFYQHQHNTPIGDCEEATKTVTVVDPRHPFFGRTFTLLGLTDHAGLGRCCQVPMEGDITRLIPIEVTDLVPERMPMYPLPLNPASLEALVNTCSDIYRPLQQGGHEDGDHEV